MEKRFKLRREIERRARQIDALLLVQHQAATQLDEHAKAMEAARRELIMLDLPKPEIARYPTFIDIL